MIPTDLFSPLAVDNGQNMCGSFRVLQTPLVQRYREEGFSKRSLIISTPYAPWRINQLRLHVYNIVHIYLHRYLQAFSNMNMTRTNKRTNQPKNQRTNPWHRCQFSLSLAICTKPRPHKLSANRRTARLPTIAAHASHAVLVHHMGTQHRVSSEPTHHADVFGVSSVNAK